ncbi:hypothetical protein RvY_14319 [Ramazzottius varieornatus]|uniref:Major facilitator superfamily (MFS) profile domain-containing protein n=1 Tax=Ramazzottius varieornatus TaxID=947166 RepID=A0A1D1VSV6_RAMVA|nr:hypothetical protein RvY_14319 [Ramazzottius varieornatus]
MIDFDEILLEVGQFGRYQKLLLVFVVLPATLPGGFHGFSQIFTVGVPGDYWCRLPPSFNISELHTILPNNQSSNRWWIPNVRNAETGNITHSRCSMYDLDRLDSPTYRHLQQSNKLENAEHFQNATFPTVPCTSGWEYDRSVYQSTLVMDWNLICDKEDFPTWSLFINTVGTLLGCLLFGFLSDRIGRKKAFFLAAIIQLASGIATAFSPNFTFFCIARFISGLTVIPVYLIPLIMGLELVGPSKRAAVGTTISFFYSLGVVGVAVVAYFVRPWFEFQLAVTLPFTFFIADWWLLPESPRWLMARGRTDEMLAIVRRIIKMNKPDLPENYLEILRSKIEASVDLEATTRKYTLVDLFRTPNLRKNSILIVFITFSGFAVYNGMNFFVPYLGGDDYVGFLLAALVELPSYFLLYFTLNPLGRRGTLMISLEIGGIFCIAAALTPLTHQKTTIVLFLISKFAITISFFVTDLIASEIFPTVVRGSGGFLAQTVSTLGLCVCPLITSVAKHYPWLPLVAFAVLAILGGFATLLLPETANQLLPETMDEGEEFGKHRTLRDILRVLPQRGQLIATKPCADNLWQPESEENHSHHQHSGSWKL